MNTKLDDLISAYQIKPKKLRKKPVRSIQKLQSSKKMKISHTIKSLTENKMIKKLNRESHSLPPKRSESNLSLSKYLNSSLDEDIEKLDILTVKNSSARLD